MEFADWPGVVDAVEGWFNQPIPAKTATMWYAELRHYSVERVVDAFGLVARSHMSPYLPALGLVLQRVRNDGLGTPLALLRGNLKAANDQFQLTAGGATDEEGDDDDGVFARGLICGTSGCGYTPVLNPNPTDRCPACGGRYVQDGHMLATGKAGATA